VVPVLGGVIGGGINVAMVRAMGVRTRRHYRDLLVHWQQSGTRNHLAADSLEPATLSLEDPDQP
jgi:hypothetical protein